MPADGGEMRAITTDPTPDWGPSWSPDGKQMAFYAYRSGNRDVWVLPLDGGPARQLTNDPAADTMPRWSPDGREILFLSWRSLPSGIWIVPAAGGEPRQIDIPAMLHAGPAVWSADGQWVALSLTRPGEAARLWRARVDGSKVEPVTVGAAGDPVWSPDGRQLFFLGVQERAGNLWAISLADRHERPVTALTGRLGSLVPRALATDGQRLFFSWEENGGDIWVMDVTSSRPE
jgi:Tol biopolymer transport system component